MVSNPECRGFVAEGFLKALSADNSSDFSSNFDAVCDSLWARYYSPFFQKEDGDSVVEDEEYGVFRVASALGYSVAHLDVSIGVGLKLKGSTDPELASRAERWLTNGPTNILDVSRRVVEPASPLFMTVPSFCGGYIGGLVFAEEFLSVGVH